MELLFEAEGPVARDRVTKKKVKIYDRKFVRFIIHGEKVVLTDLFVSPETKAFGNFPCPIYISDDWRLLEVMMFLYSPITKHPIYAVTATGHYLWEVRI